MKIIEEKANNLALELANEDGLKAYAIDPFTIRMILSLIVSIINLYLQCTKTPEEILKSIKSPNLIQRWRLKRLIRQKFNDKEVHALFGKQLFKNILNLGDKLTLDEVKSMTKEVLN